MVSVSMRSTHWNHVGKEALLGGLREEGRGPGGVVRGPEGKRVRDPFREQ